MSPTHRTSESLRRKPSMSCPRPPPAARRRRRRRRSLRSNPWRSCRRGRRPSRNSPSTARRNQSPWPSGCATLPPTRRWPSAPNNCRTASAGTGSARGRRRRRAAGRARGSRCASPTSPEGHHPSNSPLASVLSRPPRARLPSACPRRNFGHTAPQASPARQRSRRPRAQPPTADAEVPACPAKWARPGRAARSTRGPGGRAT
mmetsp:Transcript_16567/g.45881  ORF Transcript_16567/g.45881 Transcript_16567/m.45881 type:complete len:203 (-) Transcript_16567:50-658(-)